MKPASREDSQKKLTPETKDKPKSSGYGCQRHGGTEHKRGTSADQHTTRRKKHDIGQVKI